MKLTIITIAALILSGCGSFAQFTGRADPVEYALCSESTGGGAMGAITGNTQVTKIAIQGDTLLQPGTKLSCGEDGDQLTIEIPESVPE